MRQQSLRMILGVLWLVITGGYVQCSFAADSSVNGWELAQADDDEFSEEGENWDEYEAVGGNDEDWGEYEEVGGNDEDWSEYEEVGGDGETVEIVVGEEGEAADEGEQVAQTKQRFQSFTRFTPYYSSAGLVMKLTEKPSLHVGKSDEFEVYKDLFLRSYLPEWATLEASVYPMPLFGVGLKRHYISTYDKLELSDTNNLVESITAGFEEPYSVSLLLNNVTNYQGDEESSAPNVGFMGYLISGGTYHIQRNETIHDNWYELAWKVKGKFSKGPKVLSWSFQAGVKNHDHSDITDTAFISIKRDRINYDGPVLSILQNSGIELNYMVDRSDFATVEMRFLVTKYFPNLRYKKLVPTLTIGAIHQTNRKYSGELALTQQPRSTLFTIRPSIYF